jgi:hypothetical protein
LVRPNVLDRFAAGAAAEHGVKHVLGDYQGRPPWFPLRAAVFRPRDAVRGEVVGQRCRFGGVAAEPLHCG